MKENNENKKVEQLKIDFDKKLTTDEIAKKYNISEEDKKNISEKDGGYFYKNEPIDKWKKKEEENWQKEIDELYSTKDSDELYKHK